MRRIFSSSCLVKGLVVGHGVGGFYGVVGKVQRLFADLRRVRKEQTVGYARLATLRPLRLWLLFGGLGATY